MQLVRRIKRSLVGAAVVCSATVAMGGAHAAPQHTIGTSCRLWCVLVSPPSLQAVGYGWYGAREMDVLGNNFTPYTYAKIVIADTVTGKVIRTDYDNVGEAGALISIGRDGSAVDGALIFYLPLDLCGAYRNPQTGNLDLLSVQAFDGSTGLGSNVLYYQSGCL